MRSFDFQDYIAAFRSGDPAPTRRGNLVAAMRHASDPDASPG
ncbi:MAG TPA: hypothetical protein VGR11_07790 [Solirubrobacteraceae bacterium]|nr:hypothetical protein [Solirubrobacteraceae bacterium]